MTTEEILHYGMCSECGFAGVYKGNRWACPECTRINYHNTITEESYYIPTPKQVYKFAVRFKNGGVLVTALNEDEAKILAQAERIKRGLDYQVLSIQQEESYKLP